MRDGAAAPRPFDAVLTVSPASDARVAGVTLVERAAFTLARAGARRLLCLGPDPRMRRPPIDIASAPAVDAPAATTWLAAASTPVIVMDATMVVDPATVTALATARDDAPGEVVGVHGLWRAPRMDALAVAAAADRDGAPARDVRSWTPPGDGIVVAARDPAGRAAAARALFARLGRSGDGWFTRLVDRRISRVLTRLLLPTGVTPNQVTIASIALGIASGALFAIGTPRWTLAGALLFLASTIIDGCDGELARLTLRESAFGARLDVVGDNVVHVFLFAGIASGLYRVGHDPRVAVAGGLLVIGVVAAMAAVYALVVRREPSARQRTLFEAFASREFAYLLVVLTVAGKLTWFLWLSVAGTYAFVVGLVLLRR